MRHLIFDCIQFGRAHTQTNTDKHGSSRFTAIALRMFIIMHEGITQTVFTIVKHNDVDKSYLCLSKKRMPYFNPNG